MLCRRPVIVQCVAVFFSSISTSGRRIPGAASRAAKHPRRITPRISLQPTCVSEASAPTAFLPKRWAPLAVGASGRGSLYPFAGSFEHLHPHIFNVTPHYQTILILSIHTAYRTPPCTALRFALFTLLCFLA